MRFIIVSQPYIQMIIALSIQKKWHSIHAHCTFLSVHVSIRTQFLQDLKVAQNPLLTILCISHRRSVLGSNLRKLIQPNERLSPLVGKCFLNHPLDALLV